MASWTLGILQVLLLILSAPLINGVIRKLKARLQGRKGPPLVQCYYDLTRLFAKEVVVSDQASWIFHITPTLCFAATVGGCFLVPVLFVDTPLGFSGDIIALVYLLALARFFMALAALDTGSAFGGMGSSREMAVSSIAEPAMILSIFTLALTAGSTSLSTIVQQILSQGFDALTPTHILAFGALFIVTLAETGRMPVDNPATHLELTMIHEGMLLEYSGRYLALMEWSAAIKLGLFISLLSNLFFPVGISVTPDFPSLLIAVGAWAMKVLLCVLVIVLLETYLAKLRFFRLPDLLGGAFMLGVLALVTFYIFQ